VFVAADAVERARKARGLKLGDDGPRLPE
jgi:hypothetical protein